MSKTCHMFLTDVHLFVTYGTTAQTMSNFVNEDKCHGPFLACVGMTQCRLHDTVHDQNSFKLKVCLSYLLPDPNFDLFHFLKELKKVPMAF